MREQNLREQMDGRREGLADELRRGQEMLASLDAQRTELQQTLLRISGALQVLEELLAPDGPATGAVPGAGPGRPVAVAEAAS
ncbi:hypothetical protein [Pseudofrankia inefficax]|uniref:Uncharacterized protein n=1 Tax=Pseudofrankia inefficax (strain DSM 45817 / CECT 9037 / DDB 130130 / EuI1c) TaxID=298654 RepID=E3IXC7_PSEI1|nr:hypothetical protein [Pseudofrankia inefficax]ADP85027.1 hypothetical protein FraEuI1c_7062 [Pseudofrankia inefficax]